MKACPCDALLGLSGQMPYVCLAQARATIVQQHNRGKPQRTAEVNWGKLKCSARACEEGKVLRVRLARPRLVVVRPDSGQSRIGELDGRAGATILRLHRKEDAASASS